ncbi:hypothetical protein C8Q75DRAFT_441869 [Abortiporus biennis]|nr:hypothetical protein C8Q75DRAFT_441869 [Abortiporus biennis]
MSSHNWLSLPPELTYMALDFLSGDKSTLLNCAIISPTWLISSRHYLFRSVRVSHSSLKEQGFRSWLTTAPSVSSNLVRSLCIGYGSPKDPQQHVDVSIEDFRALATTFPKLEILSIHGLRLNTFTIADGTVPSPRSMVNPPPTGFPRLLKMFILVGLSFASGESTVPDPSPLVDLFQVFSTSNYLKLGDSIRPTAYGIQNRLEYLTELRGFLSLQQQKHSPQPRIVDMRGRFGMEMLDILSVIGSVSNIRVLHFPARYIRHLDRIFSGCSTSALERISLAFRRFHFRELQLTNPIIHSSKFPKLASLELHPHIYLGIGTIIENTWFAVLDTLSPLPATFSSLSEIILAITCEGSPTHLYSRHSWDWKAVRDILVQLTTLRQFRVTWKWHKLSASEWVDHCVRDCENALQPLTGNGVTLSFERHPPLSGYHNGV